MQIIEELESHREKSAGKDTIIGEVRLREYLVIESSKEAIQLKPEHILVVSAVIIAIELALRFGLFGI